MIRRAYIPVLSLVLMLAPVTLGATACSCGSSSTASAATGAGSNGCSTPPTQPCSPQATGKGTMGTISVTQSGPQQKVIWLVRATLPIGDYVLDVYVNGKRVDHKDQDYPPHATIVANQDAGLPSGAILEITGTFTPAKDDPQEFFFKCVLA